MIVIEHHKYKVISVKIDQDLCEEFDHLNICQVILKLALKFPHEIIVWIDQQVRSAVNFEKIPELLNLNRKLLSYNPSGNFFSNRIGYIEESPFININKKVTYPTWQMSSCVGAIHAATIIKLDPLFFNIKNFDFLLCSIGKHYQSLGLFCYSEPQLLVDSSHYKYTGASNYLLFKFVKNHYKSVWKYLLFVDILIYEKKVLLLPFFKTFWNARTNYKSNINFDEPIIKSIDRNEETIDVIIPTIGREKYLYDVLCDLRNQTHLPNNVIIVEQNPKADAFSALDFINNETWPFEIKHFFTHQSGVCNARNIALTMTESKWIFLADDDIVIDADFIKNAILCNVSFKTNAAIFSCLRKNEINSYNIISQTTIFGSGCSVIKRSESSTLTFNRSLEFGYGEDTDFGLQLRNIGIDVIYFPNPTILHLKAPIGGFRIKPSFLWDNDQIQPKPSPTILLYKKKHYTQEQVNGYKTNLFINLFMKEKWQKKMSFNKRFVLHWKASNSWANKLNNEN